MTPKRAEQIRHEIVNSGGWTSSATLEEDKEIMEFWKTLDGYACYHEAVCRMARGEHIHSEADEILPEDLEAVADFWDRLKPSFLGGPEK